jgi:adenylate cyclase
MPEKAVGEIENRHRLAAIMFTDLVGYTAMSARNELEALRAITSYEDIARPVFLRHNGNEIKSLGDGTLIEFDSALAAVNSAIEVQTSIHERNQGLPESEQIRLRIGIHVGEIIYRGGDVFGDGVNVASRLQTVAPPCGVCFSSDVWKLVKGKVPVQVVALGRSELKNVGRLIEVFRIRFPWDETSPAKDKLKIAMKRGDVRLLGTLLVLLCIVGFSVAYWRSRPVPLAKSLPASQPSPKLGSLIVLPFKNMSDDPKLDFWSDGLTEELIGALSTIPNTGVIGRETSSTFRSNVTDVRKVCSSLGVDAALEGSVRKDADRLRVSVRLINGASGLTLWSNNYDEPTKDVFVVQERIAKAVALQFRQKLDPSLEIRLANRGSKNASAYEEYLRGQQALGATGLQTMQKALTHFQEALKIDPQFAPAHAALSDVYYRVSNIFAPPNEVMPKARQAAEKAIALNPGLSEGYVALGQVLSCYDWDWKKGEWAYKKAISLAPGNAQAQLRYGELLTQFGRFAEAQEHLEIAMRLEPRSPEPRLSYAFLLSDSRKFIEERKVLLDLKRDFPDADPILGTLAIADFRTGRTKEGIAAVEATFKRNKLYIPAADLVGLYMTVGNKLEAQKYLGILERREVLNKYVSPYSMGLAYAEMGRLDDAYKEWDIAYQEKSEDLRSIAVEPLLDPYRSDPRFRSLLARMKLPELHETRSRP